MSMDHVLKKGLLDFLDAVVEDSVDDGDVSETEEEEIVESNHDSHSEQSSDEVEETESSEGDIFLGRGAKQIMTQRTMPRTTKRKQSDRPSRAAIDEGLKWRKTPYAKWSRTKASGIAKVSPGLTAAARDLTNEVTAFQKIIDVGMVDDIVKYTNMHIDLKRTTNSYQRERDCQNTTRCEILALIGTLFLIGTKKDSHTNVLELWATNGTGIQVLRAIMSYKRFLFLLRCLRFDDKSTRSDRKQFDKLSPIRSVLDSFVRNCKESYTVGNHVTIDEMLHSFRGRCSFVQYMPSKSAKYGLKCFAMCDVNTLYTSNFEVYCGNQPNGPYSASNSPADIVKRLVAPIEGSNRNLTTDNWYTSLSLASYLLEKKITLLGAMRKNKSEIPPEFLPKKSREIQSSLFGFQKQATLVSYVPKKNKAVILLSTMHDSPDIDKETQKPEIILTYNETKGAVETVDKMCSAYSVSRITKRWPLALFFVMLNIAGVNAQVLYFAKYSDRGHLRRKTFLVDLAFGLMKEQLALRAKITSLPSDVQAFLQKNVPADEEEDPESLDHDRKRGRCRLCKNTVTTLKCGKCSRFVCKKHAVQSTICETCKKPNFESDS